jgi:hypothetical protein
MPDWAIDLGLLLVAAFAMFNGLLMIAVPHVHRRFVSWMMRAESWSRPTPPVVRRGVQIEYRVAGLVLAMIGAMFANGAITGIRTGVEPVSAPVANIGASWFSWALGVALLAFGVYVSARPNWLVRWSAEHQPLPRDIPNSTKRTWRTGARLLGLAFSLGGLYTLWVAAKGR